MESLSILILRLSCTKKEILGRQQYEERLEQEILSYGKFKIGNVVYIYTDPMNCNNPQWRECIIRKVYFDNDFKYWVDFPDVASKYSSRIFPENLLKDKKPRERL